MSCHRTVDGAVKALRPAPEPAEPVYPVDTEPAEPAPAVETEPTPAAVVETVETDPAAVVEAVAASVVDPAADREAALERLAIRTEHVAGDVVDGWARSLDKADERHRADVAAVNAERRARQAAERALREVVDPLLLATAEDALMVIDGVLASRGVARKATA